MSFDRPLGLVPTRPLLDLDEAEFLTATEGALALAPGIDAAVRAALGRGVRSIHLLGAGGAAILLGPAARLLRRHSALPVLDDPAAEVLAAPSRLLGPDALVVVASQSGTTAETLAALDLARARGATAVALTGDAASPIARGAQLSFANAASDASCSESLYLQALLLALSVLRARGEMEGTEEIVAELGDLPRHLLRAKRGFEEEASALAEAIAGGGHLVVTAAGDALSEALSFAMCTLEEMQWIRARPVPAADFFHGTLEIVEAGVHVLLLKGEGPSRALADRVERFVPRVGARLSVVDAGTVPMPGLSPATRALLSPVILATLLERVAAHLARLRDHPLETRRYFRRMAY
jgi:fructoselysine-6-phosphate deglycase